LCASVTTRIGPSGPPFLADSLFGIRFQPEESPSRTPRRPKVVNHRKTSDPRRILLGWQKKSSLEISRFKSQKLTLVICSARSAELNPFKSSRIAIPDARKVSALYR